MKMEPSFVTEYTWPWLVKNNILSIIIFISLMMREAKNKYRALHILVLNRHNKNKDSY